MSRRVREESLFDDKLATRDVTFLYSALKLVAENATDKVKFSRQKVDDRETNFITLSKRERDGRERKRKRELFIYSQSTHNINDKVARNKM